MAAHADRPWPSRAHRHLARHLLSHAAHQVRRPWLRPYLRERRADDAKARLQRGRDRHDPGAHAAAPADLCLTRARSFQTEISIVAPAKAGAQGERRDLGLWVPAFE